jgi:glutathione S-transferase
MQLDASGDVSGESLGADGRRSTRALGVEHCIGRLEYLGASMNRLKIYSGPLSMFGAKVEIAAREKGVEYDLVMVPFDFERGYAPKHPEVLRINPKHQVPVLVDGDVQIFDSTQIFEYLEDRWPEPPLWPCSVATRAEARKLELYSDEVFFPHVIRLMGLRGNPDRLTRQSGKGKREIETHYVG